LIKPNQTELSYRRASVQEASPAGLVVIVYDILASDLRQAIAAMRSGKIEERCAWLKHGLLALQLLEGILDLEQGGSAAHMLSRFYAHIRSQILAAQFSRAERILEEQIALILDVREAWRQADFSDTPPGAPDSVAPPRASAGNANSLLAQAVTNWSA